MLYQQILSAVDKIRNKNTFLSHGAGIKCSDHSNPIFCISHGIKMYIKTQHPCFNRKSIFNAPNLNKICNLF